MKNHRPGSSRWARARTLIGTNGYTMPATQHDAVLWLSGGAYGVIFDTARAAIAALAGLATVAEETSSWPYQHDRDLTGFIDGTSASRQSSARWRRCSRA
jgi:deferrochelatase/peroxidase EfeB